MTNKGTKYNNIQSFQAFFTDCILQYHILKIKSPQTFGIDAESLWAYMYRCPS